MMLFNRMRENVNMTGVAFPFSKDSVSNSFTCFPLTQPSRNIRTEWSRKGGSSLHFAHFPSESANIGNFLGTPCILESKKILTQPSQSKLYDGKNCLNIRRIPVLVDPAYPSQDSPQYQRNFHLHRCRSELKQVQVEV